MSNNFRPHHLQRWSCSWSTACLRSLPARPSAEATREVWQGS